MSDKRRREFWIERDKHGLLHVWTGAPVTPDDRFTYVVELQPNERIFSRDEIYKALEISGAGDDFITVALEELFSDGEK